MPYDVDSFPEAQKFLDIIANSEKFKKKYGYSWIPRKDQIEKIKKAASLSDNPINYLSKLVRMFDPSYAMWKPNMKVAPGKAYDLPVPDIKISPEKAKLLPKADQQAKAQALQAKIATHNAEIERLRQAQVEAQNAAKKAQAQHEKLKTLFDEQILKYFTYIEKHCSEYLKAVHATGKILYRGQDDTSLPIFVGHPRKNREAKDSSPKAQELYDKYLSLMGFKALRSNSIFTTSDKHHAGGYGSTFAIFPKNGFKFTWATEASDLVLSSISDVTGENDEDDIENLYYEYNDDIENFDQELADWFYDLEETDKSKIKVVKASNEYKTFNKAISKWDNISLYDTTSTKRLYLVLTEIFTTFKAFIKKFPKFKDYTNIAGIEAQNYLNLAKQNLNKPVVKNDKMAASKMIKRFGLKDDNMVAALKSGNEVCILGEYIAVEFDKYEKQIKAFFLVKQPAKKPAPKKNIIKPVKMKAKPGGQGYAGGNIKKKLGGDLGGFKV